MKPPPLHGASPQCTDLSHIPDPLTPPSTAGRCRVAGTPRPETAIATLNLVALGLDAERYRAGVRRVWTPGAPSSLIVHQATGHSLLDDIVELDVGIRPEAAVSGAVLIQTEFSTHLTFNAMRPTDKMRLAISLAVAPSTHAPGNVYSNATTTIRCQ